MGSPLVALTTNPEHNLNRLHFSQKSQAFSAEPMIYDQIEGDKSEESDDENTVKTLSGEDSDIDEYIERELYEIQQQRKLTDKGIPRSNAVIKKRLTPPRAQSCIIKPIINLISPEQTSSNTTGLTPDDIQFVGVQESNLLYNSNIRISSRASPIQGQPVPPPRPKPPISQKVPPKPPPKSLKPKPLDSIPVR